MANARVSQVYVEVPVIAAAVSQSLLDVDSLGYLTDPPGGAGTAYSTLPANLTAAQATALVLRGWTGIPSGDANYQLVGGAYGSPSVALGLNGSVVQERFFQADDPTGITAAIVGFHFKCPAGAASSGQRVAVLENVASGEAVGVYISGSSGDLTLRVALNTAVDTGVVVADGAWHYIELQDIISNVGGSPNHNTTVWVDGASTNINQRASGSAFSMDRVAFHAHATLQFLFGDIYLGTTTDSPMGVTRVECLFPNADGANLGWTPDSGSDHFSRVYEAPEDGLTSYVKASLTGALDTYDMPSLASTTGAIPAVQVTATADQDAAFALSFGVAMSSSGTVGVSAGTTLNVGSGGSFNAGLVQNFFTTDPHTAAAWAIAGINAAQIGQQLITGVPPVPVMPWLVPGQQGAIQAAVR